jgi:ribosomal protein L11
MSEQNKLLNIDCVVCYENENMDKLICCNQPICTTCIRKIKKNSCPHCRNNPLFTELKNATIKKLGSLIVDEKEEISEDEKEEISEDDLELREEMMLGRLNAIGIDITNPQDSNIFLLNLILNCVEYLNRRRVIIEPGDYTMDRLTQITMETYMRESFGHEHQLPEGRRRRRPRPN